MRLIPAVLIVVAAALGQTAGERLPPWTPGTLDLHQIHTGRGNAALMIFPDGTTLLLDAGAIPERSGPEVGPMRPNPSRTAAEWIAHYVRHFAESLDYAVMTHYHDDHVGGLPAVAARLPVRTLIDRGDDPAPPDFPVVRQYLEFRRRFTGTRETLRAGRADQIVPRRSVLPEFEVRNVAVNGVVWTGRGEEAALRFPPGWKTLSPTRQPTENHFSIALRIRYGPFRYYTGGDLVGVVLDNLPAWHDLETPVAQAVGAVDVAVLNHHGFLDTTNDFFLKTLNPRVVVIPAWHAAHPDHSVLRRLRSPDWKAGPPELFTTSLLEATRAVFSYLGGGIFQSTEGHIVVRVERGGGSYRVIVLDDGTETPTVKSVYGPYRSGAKRP